LGIVAAGKPAGFPASVGEASLGVPSGHAAVPREGDHSRGCRIAAVGLAAMLLITLPAGARSILPDRAAAAGAQVRGNAVDRTSGGIRIRVEPLAPAQVADWFRSRTRTGDLALPMDGSVMDPADGQPAPKGKKPGAPLTVFAVSFENGSGEHVTFVADLSSLTDEHGDEHAPLPADWLRNIMRQAYSATADPDRSADEAMGAIHAGPLILKHGQRASRLLIFPPKPKAKKLVLTLGHLAVGARDVSPAFAFVVVD
jgi:hypothetical protein